MLLDCLNLTLVTLVLPFMVGIHQASQTLGGICGASIFLLCEFVLENFAGFCYGSDRTLLDKILFGVA